MGKLTRTSLAAALALGVGAAGALAAGAPTVRFVDVTPIQVRGAGFAAGETVRVTLRAGSAKRVRAVAASSGGGFRVTFLGVRQRDRCGVPMRLVAVGSSGDRATYRLAARECPTVSTT